MTTNMALPGELRQEALIALCAQRNDMTSSLQDIYTGALEFEVLFKSVSVRRFPCSFPWVVFIFFSIIPILTPIYYSSFHFLFHYLTINPNMVWKQPLLPSSILAECLGARQPRVNSKSLGIVTEA